jgi:hypothetical protein
VNPADSHPPELDGLLADAVAAVRNASVEESLVDRCRHRALTVVGEAQKQEVDTKVRRFRWRVPLTAAAAVLVAINLLQAYARLPASDRQLAAMLATADAENLYIYSDLRIEPAVLMDRTERSKI